MYKEKIIKLKSYNDIRIRFVISDDLKKVKKKCKVKIGRKHFIGYVNNAYVKEEGVEYKAIILLINRDHVTLDNLSYVLVHEFIHVRSIVYRDLGILVDFYNDEAEAFLMSHLMEECLEFFTEMIKATPTKE